MSKVFCGTRSEDSYERLCMVGKGGYGEVFKAKDKVSGKIVALKKMFMKDADTGIYIPILREIRFMQKLRHENLVNLLEVVTDKDYEKTGGVFLVMEYLEYDVAGLLDSIRFSTDEIRVYMHQLLKVVAHIHAKGVIHRDLKCSNLLVNAEHLLKLADFGLTKQVKPGESLNYSMITLWYRPPEMLLGKSDYDQSVDMWSLGCILAEFFTGSALFTKKTEEDQTMAIFHVFGCDDIQYAEYQRERLPHLDRINRDLVPKQPIGIINYIRQRAKREIPKDAMDLIRLLLTVRPRDRISAETALENVFFSRGVDRSRLIPLSERLSKDLDYHEFHSKKRRKHQLAPPAPLTHPIMDSGVIPPNGAPHPSYNAPMEPMMPKQPPPPMPMMGMQHQQAMMQMQMQQQQQHQHIHHQQQPMPPMHSQHHHHSHSHHHHHQQSYQQQQPRQPSHQPPPPHFPQSRRFNQY